MVVGNTEISLSPPAVKHLLHLLRRVRLLLELIQDPQQLVGQPDLIPRQRSVASRMGRAVAVQRSGQRG